MISGRKQLAERPFFIESIADHYPVPARTFHFQSCDGQPFPFFQPGQYVSVKNAVNNSPVSRGYSICSSPALAASGRVSITVHANPGGFAADHILANWKPGDIVSLSGPHGDFVYNPATDSDSILCLAGGSGITPYMSMAYAIRDGFLSCHMTILYGNQSRESTLFTDELARLSEDPRIQIVYVFAAENGFIKADTILHAWPSKESAVFISGPAPMCRSMKEEIKKAGIPELFIREMHPPIDANSPDYTDFPLENKGKLFQATIHSVDGLQTILVSGNEPLLVGFERNGIKTQSACRCGECGWCGTVINSGNCYVPATNDLRTDEEKKSRFIHPCCSFPCSDLDLTIN